MRNYPNIESRRTGGHYIAYDATGRSWRITGRSGVWTARANVTVQGLIGLLCGYERLSEISAELAAIGSKTS